MLWIGFGFGFIHNNFAVRVCVCVPSPFVLYYIHETVNKWRLAVYSWQSNDIAAISNSTHFTQIQVCTKSFVLVFVWDFFSAVWFPENSSNDCGLFRLISGSSFILKNWKSVNRNQEIKLNYIQFHRKRQIICSNYGVINHFCSVSNNRFQKS